MNPPRRRSAVRDARTDRSGAATTERRREIVEAAVATFAEKGYEGATTRDIAQAAHLKQGHLYYYFPAKEDLLFVVVDDLHQRFLDGLQSWPREDASADELRAVLSGHVRMACERQMQVVVAYESVRFLSPHRRQIIIDKRNQYERAISALVADRVPDGNQALAPTITRAVLGIVNWVYQWYSDSGPLDASRLASQFAEIACALVAVPQATLQRIETRSPRRP